MYSTGFFTHILYWDDLFISFIYIWFPATICIPASSWTLKWNVQVCKNKYLKCFRGLHFKFVFKTVTPWAHSFRYKDKLTSHLYSESVNSFHCPDCNITYIGCTHRILRIRISEHKCFSFRTGRRYTNPRFSVIRKYSREKNHIIREDDFQLLFKSNHSALRIAESLFTVHL